MCRQYVDNFLLFWRSIEYGCVHKKVYVYIYIWISQIRTFVSKKLGEHVEFSCFFCHFGLHATLGALYCGGWKKKPPPGWHGNDWRSAILRSTPTRPGTVWEGWRIGCWRWLHPPKMNACFPWKGTISKGSFIIFQTRCFLRGYVSFSGGVFHIVNEVIFWLYIMLVHQKG